MTTNTHISKEQLAAFAADPGDPGLDSDVKTHLESCESCQATLEEVRAFSHGLDRAWNVNRLQAMNVLHPSSSQLEAYWLESGSTDAPVAAHVAQCEDCKAHVQRLELGYASLLEDDPLGVRIAWRQVVSQRFAAGIEVAVEAARGAFTTAGGMIQEVMTPQATARLSPVGAIAMGGGAVAEAENAEWHEASFQTDEISGEVTGSTDVATGRGMLAVVVNKSNLFVAQPPLVDLLNGEGSVVSSQYALDTGDRYTTQFTNLDQGHYLVGIREPGA